MRNKSFLNRKGQIQSLTPAITALVIAAIFLVLGLIIIANFRDNNIMTSVFSPTVANETVGPVNNFSLAVHTLAGGASPGSNSFSLIYILNETGANETVATGNFTVADGGVLTFVGDDIWNGSTVRITYSYTHGDTAFTQTNKTLVGIGTFGDFWEIIVLAIVIGIVIGLLLVIFGGRRQR